MVVPRWLCPFSVAARGAHRRVPHGTEGPAGMTTKEIKDVEEQVLALQERLGRLEKQRPMLATQNTQLHAALVRRTQCLAEHSPPAIVIQERANGHEDRATAAAAPLAGALMLCRGLGMGSAAIQPADLLPLNIENLACYTKEIVQACETLLPPQTPAQSASDQQLSSIFGFASQFWSNLRQTEDAAVLLVLIRGIHEDSLAMYGAAPETIWEGTLDQLQLTAQQQAALQQLHVEYMTQVEDSRQRCRLAAERLQSNLQDSDAAPVHGKNIVELLLDHIGNCVALLTPAQMARALVASKPWTPDVIHLMRLLGSEVGCAVPSMTP